jgi:hypothetical protein
MAIKASEIDLLRKITGKSMQDCLIALKDADGDFMIAVERLGGDIKNSSALSSSSAQVFTDGSNTCPTCKNPLTNSTKNCEWCDAPLASNNNSNFDDVYLGELIRMGRLLEAVKHYKDSYNVTLKEAKNQIDILAASEPNLRRTFLGWRLINK